MILPRSIERSWSVVVHVLIDDLPLHIYLESITQETFMCIVLYLVIFLILLRILLTLIDQLQIVGTNFTMGSETGRHTISLVFHEFGLDLNRILLQLVCLLLVEFN